MTISNIDHYLIETPFVVSFSGGRTSAFMLRNILDAYGGSLPAQGHVVFANTGKEHPATLDFIKEIETRWSVPIQWVERDFKNEAGVRLVNFDTASKNGEPFGDLITKKHYLPNPITRFCTEELKVKAIAKYMKSIGVESGTMAVGLRADEPRRVHRVNGDTRNGFDYVCPMHSAGHVIADVLEFWKSSDFDLMLPNNDRAFGNCDLCFLKGRSILERVIRHDPSLADWWIEREKEIGAKFRKDIPTFAQMVVQIRIQPELFGEEDDDDIIPCLCTD